jgi:predicted unusual protein kinase regulating ubiquinone biosynthesis (AarF/ABC1/UbiB family)
MLEWFWSRYIVYAKVLQWMSANFENPIARFIERWTRRFTNNAPYVQDDVDVDSLNELMSRNPDLVIEDVPMNSGTIALVFPAKLNGTDIVVKTMRRRARDRMASAVSTISTLLNVLDRFMNVGSVIVMFNDVSETLWSQTDFLNETKNIRLLNSAMRTHRLARQPRVYSDMSTPTLIVMDRIRGMTVYEVEDEDRSRFADAFISVTFYACFVKYTYHLDLHPGNVLFSKENGLYCVTLLDMGMLMVVEPTFCDLIYDLVWAVMQQSSDAMVSVVCEYSELVFKRAPTDPDFKTKIQLEFESYFKTVDLYSLATDVIGVMSVLKKHDCEISETLNVLVLSFVSIIGIMSSLDTAENIQKRIHDRMTKIRNL